MLKSGVQLEESMQILFNSMIEKMKRDDEYKNSVEEKMIKNIENRRAKLEDFNNNYNSMISSKNESIIKINTAKNGTNSELFPPLGEISITKYFNEHIISNISCEFNVYCKEQWESIKCHI